MPDPLQFVEFKSNTSGLTVVERQDPLFGTTYRMATEPVYKGPKAVSQENPCELCAPLYGKELPHAGGVSYRTNSESPVYRTIHSSDHKTLGSLNFNDIDNAFLAQRAVAENLQEERRRNHKIIGMETATKAGRHLGSTSYAVLEQPGYAEAEELHRSHDFFRRHGANLFDVFANEESERGERSVFFNDRIYIGTSFANPNELILIPRASYANILEASPQDIECYRALLATLQGIENHLGIGEVELVTHMAPFTEMNKNGSSAHHYYRWHVHVGMKKHLPEHVTTRETTTGIDISSPLPEAVAKQLRKGYMTVKETPSEALAA